MKRIAPITLIVVTVVLMGFLSGCATGSEVDMTTEPVPVAAAEGLALGGIGDLRRVMQLTGEDSPNRTDQYMVHGTDLGSMFDSGDRLYILFGDTFGPRPIGHTGGGGSLWRSNTLAYTTDRDPSDGIEIEGMISTSTGTAKQIIYSSHSGGEVTKIPTNGVVVDGAFYVYFMSVNEWAEPGQWYCNYAGVAKSTDSGENFEVIDGLQWPGDSNFVQTAIAESGEHLYFWTIPGGRFGGAALMRVRPGSIEDLSAYEYFAGVRRGEPRWSEAIADARLIVEAPVGELSVIWNEYLGRWIMTYLNERSHAIELRESVDPWGPWSEPFELVPASKYPALYGAYMHPWYLEEEGRVIYFNMSQWMPYNVFLMRAELVRRP